MGQKRDTPDETDSLRKFYSSLRLQKPESEMAEMWLMEHGLLPEEEQKKAYKKMLARKGKSAPAKRPASASKPRPPSARKWTSCTARPAQASIRQIPTRHRMRLLSDGNARIPKNHT